MAAKGINGDPAMLRGSLTTFFASLRNILRNRPLWLTAAKEGLEFSDPSFK
jgi:hypothetical protein